MLYSTLLKNAPLKAVLRYHYQTECSVERYQTPKNIPQNIAMIRYCVFWFVRTEVQFNMNPVWVEQEKHQRICFLPIRVVDFVSGDETTASTISTSASSLICTTLHLFWRNLSEITLIKANIYEISIDTHQLHYIPLPTLQSYYLTRYLGGRNEFVNAKDNEFNSAAISLLWHHRQCFAAASLTWPAYGDGRKRENWSVWKKIVLLLHPRVDVSYSLVVT